MTSDIMMVTSLISPSSETQLCDHAAWLVILKHTRMTDTGSAKVNGYPERRLFWEVKPGDAPPQICVHFSAKLRCWGVASSVERGQPLAVVCFRADKIPYRDAGLLRLFNRCERNTRRWAEACGIAAFLVKTEEYERSMQCV